MAGQDDWTSRRLHLSRHTGQALDDWSSYKPPELSTGSCVVSETLSQLHELLAVSFPPLCFSLLRDLEGVTSTDRTGDPPTFPSTGENTHTRNLDNPKCSGVAVLWRLCMCDRSFLKSLPHMIPHAIFLFLRNSR